MFGLGLSLRRRRTSTRLLKHPKAVVVALVLQVVRAARRLLRHHRAASACRRVFAVGLMLLAASPGGISANLFSHLFGGNVAMNISLTAINTLLSIVTMPLIANWAIDTFAKTGQVVPLQFGKVVEVIAIVLVPVVDRHGGRAPSSPASPRAWKSRSRSSARWCWSSSRCVAIAKEWEALSAGFASHRPGGTCCSTW